VLLHNLTPIQIDLVRDEKHRIIILPPGRRSRKTLIAKHKLVFRALDSENQNFFAGAPTHHQAKSIFWEDLKRALWYFTTDRSETELKIKLKNGSVVQVVGLDKPERIEGQPWNGCVITEIGNCKEDAWGAHIRPTLSDTNGWAILEGVPEGMNFLYDLALRATGNAIPKTLPKVGAFRECPDDPAWRYYHWFSSDVLSPAEIAAARMELDEKTFRQEYEGSFENYEGLAYWAFNVKNLSDCEYNKSEHIHIGMDFNHDPMTATFNHIRSNDVFQFGEAFLPNSNTYEMAEHIKRLFPISNCTIYPDATGDHESSNATRSDIAILRQAGFRVLARSVNPLQRDRINAVNSKMMASDGKPHYFINAKNCPKTINDWNKVNTTADGRIDKEGEKTKLTHISDAEGYLISFNFPVIKNWYGGVKI